MTTTTRTTVSLFLGAALATSVAEMTADAYAGTAIAVPIFVFIVMMLRSAYGADRAEAAKALAAPLSDLIHEATELKGWTITPHARVIMEQRSVSLDDVAEALATSRLNIVNNLLLTARADARDVQVFYNFGERMILTVNRTAAE